MAEPKKGDGAGWLALGGILVALWQVGEMHASRKEQAAQHEAAISQQAEAIRLQGAPCLAIENRESAFVIARHCKECPLGNSTRRIDGKLAGPGGYPVIQNVGKGAAMNCRVEWIASLVNGAPVNVTKTKTVQLSDLTLREEERAWAEGLPECIEQDKDGSVKSVDGWLLMMCEDTVGKLHGVQQRFLMHPSGDHVQVRFIGKPQVF